MPIAPLASAPRWITSWPDWHGIPGNTEVVPSSDYDALLTTHLELVGQFNGAIKMLQEANEVCRSASSIAQREGKYTEWDSFRYRLQKVLEAQHSALYPSASTTGPRTEIQQEKK